MLWTTSSTQQITLESPIQKQFSDSCGSTGLLAVRQSHTPTSNNFQAWKTQTKCIYTAGEVNSEGQKLMQAVVSTEGTQSMHLSADRRNSKKYIK